MVELGVGLTSEATFVDNFKVRWPRLSSEFDLERDLTLSNASFRAELEVDCEAGVGFFRFSFELVRDVEVGELRGHSQQHNFTAIVSKS